MDKRDFLKQGLTSAQVEKRLEEHGPNELAKPKKHSDLILFATQFKSPLAYILVLAGVVTIILREWTDVVVIFAAVILNTALGFYQERKAQRALEALRSLIVPKTTVIRDGSQQEVDASQLVPGDLVILTIGSKVPADGVVVKATDLTLNEAILTGESRPVDKKATGDFESQEKKSQVFMGTAVVAGIGRMVVVKTGVKTEMGKIGSSLQSIEDEKTPLQLQLGNLAKTLALLVAVFAVAVFGFGLYKGHGFTEMFTTSVAVAVASIPEGLIVTLTVILALGMQRILKRKALVRKLVAAETLGSVSMICADKTGTLTEGEMKVVKAVIELGQKGSGSKKKLEWLMKSAILCNDMRDPLEVAMWEWSESKRQEFRYKDIKSIQAEYPRLDEVPFSPDYKYIATLHAQNGGKVLFVSGAPEVVLAMSGETEAQKKKWLEKFEDLGRQGYRLVGFSYKERVKNDEVQDADLANLNWLGVLVYEDPVRSGVKVALKECVRAGIKVKVITGDYASTAQAVLAKLELFGKASEIKVMEGAELEKISEKELARKLEEVSLFARTTPEQKLKIVQVLKEQGEVVAMTGDGVNDAPALAKADIGIVVGDASDVAKETADMVLLDSDFSTIVAAVREGRTIFENIRKVVLYLLSDSFTEVILIGGSLVFGLPLPVTASQILWVNLVEDALPGMALAFEPGEKGVMAGKPRPRQAPILDRQLKALIFIIGISTDLLLLGLFYWLLRGFLHLEHIQSVMFVALGINSLFYIYACRSLRRPLFKMKIWENWLLNISVLVGLVMLVAAVYFPPLQLLLKTASLDLKSWLLLIGIGLFNLVAIEVAKMFFIFRRRKGMISSS